jgi:hypothetical protein
MLPLLGSIISGLLGRKIGVTGSHIITISCLIVTSIFSIIAFYEVGICDSPVSIQLTSWVNSEYMNISWGFLFDSLTVSMLIPVLFISTLVHLYSINYMAEDPHNQRFFSYLSLFTFFMIVLVTGDNYLVLFLGWEGNYILHCLTFFNNPYFFNSIDESSIMWLSLLLGPIKCSSINRIGPHNIDVLSVLIGSILGDSHLERRINGIGTRVIFEQSNKNVEYLMWFHKFFSEKGYCNPQKPKLFKRIIQNNQILFYYRISSFTFYSFNWIHDMFYILENGKFRKKIPTNISDFLTPLVLAIWFMEDGSKSNNSVRIATNNFNYDEILFISVVLFEKYRLITTPQYGGKNKGYILYFSTKSMVEFTNIVKPYMLPSMYYKLGNY